MPPNPEERCEDTLYLSVTVRRSSRPDQDVEKCDKCCARDRKTVKGKAKVERVTRKEEGSHIESLTADSSMISFKGLKRQQQFDGGNLYLSLYIRCYSSHHNEPNGYRCVDYSLHDEARVATDLPFRVTFILVDAAENIIKHWTVPAVMITGRRGHIPSVKDAQREGPGAGLLLVSLFISQLTLPQIYAVEMSRKVSAEKVAPPNHLILVHCHPCPI